MKKFISVVCSTLMCMMAIPTGSFSFADDWKPFEGSGTEDDPYQISTKYELFLLAELVNDDDRSADFYDKYYIQTTDIDLKNDNFTPIGTREESGGKGFSGIYNGNYHNVYNLYVERDYNFNGLFGWTYGGAIENLTVYGKINCPDSNYCGGIVGDIGSVDAKYIKNCAFVGNVTGKNDVGGIAGTSWISCTIENCYFNGKLKTSNGVSGGIIGLINNGSDSSDGSSSVKNCYAVSSVENGCTGGIVGTINKNNEKSVSSIENNYYLSKMASTGIKGDVTGGCSKLNENLMYSADELLGSPFIHNNDKSVNNGYPIFEWQAQPYQFKGNGTEEDPYCISCKEDLFAFKNMIKSPYFKDNFESKYYIQTSNIDLNNDVWNSEGFKFKGVYNGNHKSIKNLNIDCESSYAGLFGISCGEISDLSVYGNVKSTQDYVGGIVGEISENATISNCSFNGNITGNENVGGIAGKVFKNGSIISCYHIGAVNANSKAGGILGYIHTDSMNATVKSCYHSGKVSSSDKYAGGVVGEYVVDKNNSVNISNCYYINSDVLNGINAVNIKHSTKRETTTSTENTLDGWTIDESLTELGYGEWSDWSDWSTNAVSESDLRKVETKQESGYSDWGGWSDWSTNEIGGNELREIETKQESYSTSNNVYFPACSYTGGSFVDGLKNINVNSSFDERKRIAETNGISNYSGTYDQNVELLNKLKAGTLINYVETNTGYTTYYRYRERSTTSTTYYRYSERPKVPTVYHFYRDVEIDEYEDTSSNSDIMSLTSKLLKQVASDLGSPYITNTDADFNDGYPIFEWQLAIENDTVYGDANADGKVSVADAVAILQYIGNRDKYKLSETGLKNADVDGVAGITGKDALVIQQVDAGIYKSEDLPLKAK